MNRIFYILLCAAFFILPAGCRRHVPYRGPAIEKPAVQVLSKYPAGSDLRGLLDAYNLDGAEVRYRDHQAAGRISALYFLENGNLHVEAQEAGDGRNLLLSTPYFEPAEGTITERVFKWDNALEPSAYPGGRQ